jgi:hypothetical protein
MKEEELIKKLENTALPGIEVQSHRRRLRMALLDSEYFREQPKVGVFGQVSSTVKRGVDVLRGLISWRPVWKPALVSTLAIALIVGSALFVPSLVSPPTGTLILPNIAGLPEESDTPAKPILSSPANSSRVGFIGKQALTFQWTVVTEFSGVSYKLQITSDPSFVNLTISEVSGLTETSYTLPQGQALPYGTYYWRVKAIDSAQNDSGWTAPHSFQVGLMPLWTFIVIVVVIGMLVAALVYRFALKR